MECAQVLTEMVLILSCVISIETFKLKIANNDVAMGIIQTG